MFEKWLKLERKILYAFNKNALRNGKTVLILINVVSDQFLWNLRFNDKTFQINLDKLSDDWSVSYISQENWGIEYHKELYTITSISKISIQKRIAL